ncbi:MAG: hypothetical protein H6718_05285 [Polyangiaceae bacterium]|nr:hypothetical protein [Myxococcales bacterium]MCB9584786.1 hypothetical protein [Polyangiaceae bacterium]MCB9607641.1 hypothetical protein [Polyangiaceae bacterium]
MPGTRPSFPVPSEPSLRRLGVGGSSGGSGGGDRPLRAQLVVAVCIALVVIALPLYFLRRPSGHTLANASASASAALAPSSLPIFAIDAGTQEERVRLGPVQRVKCSASPAAKGQEGALCDKLPFFEEALAKAVKDNVDCAPKTGKEGSINFAMSIDFDKKRISVFPGQSGDWRGPQAKRTTQCVSRSLPPAQWDTIQHQYRYYLFAILATYPVPPPSEGPPTFE